MNPDRDRLSLGYGLQHTRLGSTQAAEGLFGRPGMRVVSSGRDVKFGGLQAGRTHHQEGNAKNSLMLDSSSACLLQSVGQCKNLCHGAGVPGQLRRFSEVSC